MGKFGITSVLLLSAFSAIASNYKVVYGEDNRLDVVEVSNALHAKLALSTAAMVENKKIETTGTRCSLKFNQTLETRLNVCPSEKFAQQSTGAMCSGFLVGEDTLVTAGHCLKMLGSMGYATAEDVCKGFSWVFNYAVDKRNRDPRIGATNDVYRCKSVVAAELGRNTDFAVIKLDRKVVGRAPLKFRTAGKVGNSASLVVIGHPSGIPTKVAAGARVLSNSGKTNFGASLDTFQGNSGSAVFDAKTGMLEGILVQGKTDYRPNQPSNPMSCKVVNTCLDTGKNCAAGGAGDSPFEVVTRISEALPAIKAGLKLTTR